MPHVYVASPLGFSPATQAFYQDVLLRSIAASGWFALDPWADPDGQVAARFAAADTLAHLERCKALAAIDSSLGQANERMIRRADALLAVLDGTDVDSGTAAEIGFAAALGKPTIGLRLDTRRTGDNDGTIVNLQVQHFIESRGGRVCTTVPQAVAALAGVAP